MFDSDLLLRMVKHRCLLTPCGHHLRAAKLLTLFLQTLESANIVPFPEKLSFHQVLRAQANETCLCACVTCNVSCVRAGFMLACEP